MTNGGTCNRILGANLPTEGFIGADPENRIRVRFTNRAGEEVEFFAENFPGASKPDKLMIQPVYFLRQMTEFEVGEAVQMTIEVICSGASAGETEVYVIRGE